MWNADKATVGKRLGAVAGVLLLAISRHAPAEPAPVQFSVDPRAKGCPSATEFRAEVDRQMGDDGASAPSLEDGPRVDVHIDVIEGGGLRARLEVDEPSAAHRRQTLDAPAYACRDLSSAAAIAVSLVFRAAAGARKPPEPEPPKVEPPRPPPVRPPPPPPPTAPVEPSIRHSLFAGGLVGRSAGPGLGVGALAGYGATWRRRWGLVAEASATLPRVAAGARDAGVVITTRTVSIAPCAYYGIALGCAFASLGSTVGSGTNVRDPETRHFVHAELGLRLGARLPLAGPFALRTELRSGFPLVRSRFLVEGDTVFETPAVTVMGSVSLETIF